MKKITSVGLVTILGLALATGSVQASVKSTTPESMPAMFAQLDAVPLSDAALDEVQGAALPAIIAAIALEGIKAGGRVLIGTLFRTAGKKAGEKAVKAAAKAAKAKGGKVIKIEGHDIIAIFGNKIYKIGFHPPHHNFKEGGRQWHMQVTRWTKGVDNSHKHWYFPFGP